MEAELKFLLQQQEITPWETELLRVDSQLGEFKGEKFLPVWQNYFSRYYDSATALLSQAGSSLRLRSEAGTYIMSVKQGLPALSGVFCRSEWETQLSPKLAESIITQGLASPTLGEIFATFADPALKELLSSLPPQNMTVIAELEFKRLARLYSTAQASVELALDCGYFKGQGRADIAFSELEVELKRGELLVLAEFTRGIAATVELRPQKQSKLERCLRYNNEVLR